MRIGPLLELPPNIDTLVDDVARGIGALYGAPAATHHRQTARRILAGTLAHPAVWAAAAYDGSDVVAYLLGILRDGAGQVSFAHVLPSHVGLGLEGLLAQQAVHDFWDAGACHVMCEVVPLAPLDLASTMERLGFEHQPRELMIAPNLEADVAYPDTRRARDITPQDWEAVADCLVRAYAGGPGRRLHFEMNTRQHALGFAARVAGGNFGRVRPGNMTGFFEDTRCIAALLGCETAPETGFILQLVTDPGYRRQGLANALLLETRRTFHAQGMRQTALGVTRSNPARALYLRQGFRPVKPVDAYTWWAPGAFPPS